MNVLKCDYSSEMVPSPSSSSAGIFVAYTSRIAEPVKKDCKLNLGITRFILKDCVVLDMVTESVRVDGYGREIEICDCSACKVYRTIVIKS